jgi:maltose alpha-D-glucosyltransferase / alpha-amylase
MDSVYGFEAVNVEAQSRSPSSLLNWMKRMIAARRARRAFGRGTLKFLYPSNRKVIAYLRCYEDEIILCVANLSRSPQAVELDLSEFRGRQPVELLGRSAFPMIGELPYLLTLQGHSFFWFDLLASEQEATNMQMPPPEFVTLVMPQGWGDLSLRHNMQQLENDVFPTFLARQRWFAAKDRRIEKAAVAAKGVIARAPQEGAASDSYLAEIIDVRLRGGGGQRYFLPLATVWGAAESESRQGLAALTVAELRQFRREGALVDALSQDGFALTLMDAIARDARLPLEGGEIRCAPTISFEASMMPERFTVRRGSVEQSNTSVFFDEYGMLKLYRRLEPGPHPEIEISRFLVERAGFANTPPPLATLELRLDGDGGMQSMALGVLFGFVRNQGDGWAQALDYLTRYLDDALIASGERSSELPDPDHFFLALARQIGIRTAEMHRALATQGENDPAFAPEPITRDDIVEWRRALEAGAAAMLAQLQRERTRLPERAEGLAAQLTAARDDLLAVVRTLLPDEICGLKTRLHGDYHLGQTIVVHNDFYIVDFEGEPSRPLAERRAKSSPLRDVAGMIRSFDYAAVTAVRRLAETRAAAEPRMTELAESWRQRAVDGFRAAYRKTMRGCRSYPENKKQANDLIAFFTLEKAVYEVSYELANRPAWVDIPLQGILAILNRRKAAGGGAAD